ncbi:heterokaryon incompatibility protein-domain-containing protein, partial [Phaeosphaeriaceae sp. PMI808]
MKKEKPPKYIFLSACWGRDFALRLNHSNHERLQEEIKITELPKTIRDAIAVARALHIDYIFVDSLCILQDSMEDWHKEVERMESYIKGCTLTLGAGSSASLAAGFLDIRSDQKCFNFTVQTVGSLPGAKIFLRPHLPSDWDSLSSDPLFTRLWTLQELSICPRSILFGSSRIRLRFDILLGKTEAAEASHSQRTDQTDRLTGPAKLLREVQDVYDAWHTIIETASQLKVTFERDRLPALSAFISIVRRKLNDDKLINGLWRGNLHRDLLWHRADTPLRVTADESIPSWSWAAYSG